MPKDKGKHRLTISIIRPDCTLCIINRKNRQNVQNKNGEQGIIKVNSPEQAGEKVLELVNSGLSYRDISKKSSP